MALPVAHNYQYGASSLTYAPLWCPCYSDVSVQNRIILPLIGDVLADFLEDVPDLYQDVV